MVGELLNRFFRLSNAANLAYRSAQVTPSRLGKTTWAAPTRSGTNPLLTYQPELPLYPLLRLLLPHIASVQSQLTSCVQKQIWFWLRTLHTVTVEWHQPSGNANRSTEFAHFATRSMAALIPAFRNSSTPPAPFGILVDFTE